MPSYFRDPRMVEGGSFYCYSCQSELIQEIIDSRRLKLACSACGINVHVHCSETIPFVVRELIARQTAGVSK